MKRVMCKKNLYDQTSKMWFKPPIKWFLQSLTFNTYQKKLIFGTCILKLLSKIQFYRVKNK